MIRGYDALAEICSNAGHRFGPASYARAASYQEEQRVARTQSKIDADPASQTGCGVFFNSGDTKPCRCIQNPMSTLRA
jgi:hypothetical protein